MNTGGTMTATEGREELTGRQLQVLRAIVAYTKRHGYGPSIRDLCKTFGTEHPNAIVCHLKPLAKKGYITRGEPIDADGRAAARGIVVPELAEAVKAAAGAYLAGLDGE